MPGSSSGTLGSGVTGSTGPLAAKRSEVRILPAAPQRRSAVPDGQLAARSRPRLRSSPRGRARCFDAHKHKTLATLRKDGSPRISGTEVVFRRRRDVDREHVARRQGARPPPRSALRDSTAAPTRRDWTGRRQGRRAARGDRGAGAQGRRRIRRATPRPGPMHLFRCDVERARRRAARRPGRPPGDRVLARGPRPRGVKR